MNLLDELNITGEDLKRIRLKLVKDKKLIAVLCPDDKVRFSEPSDPLGLLKTGRIATTAEIQESMEDPHV